MKHVRSKILKVQTATLPPRLQQNSVHQHTASSGQGASRQAAQPSNSRPAMVLPSCTWLVSTPTCTENSCCSVTSSGGRLPPRCPAIKQSSPQLLYRSSSGYLSCTCHLVPCLSSDVTCTSAWLSPASQQPLEANLTPPPSTCSSLHLWHFCHHCQRYQPAHPCKSPGLC